MSTWGYTCAWGQGHSLNLVRSHSDFIVVNIFKHLLRNCWASQNQISCRFSLRWGKQQVVQMILVTWPRWPPCLCMVKTFKKSSFLELIGQGCWKLVYSIGYSSTTKVVQMMTLGWPWPFLWHGQICFLMLLYGWTLIQHIVMYFQACSNSAYPVHSGERYRINGPLVDDYVCDFKGLIDFESSSIAFCNDIKH